mmetsp:Transcript_20070/g.30052  ORF Transcript_20070/g.30052 Transcript_20070/m.30052 type:complete len:88 (+) Transcript_20070:1-264(+)
MASSPAAKAGSALTNPYKKSTPSISTCSDLQKRALKCLTDGEESKILTGKKFSRAQCTPLFDSFRNCKREEGKQAWKRKRLERQKRR